MSFTIGVLKKFTNFTREDICWGLFLIKLQAFSPATLWTRDSNTGVFFVKFANFLRTPSFTKHLRWFLLVMIFTFTQWDSAALRIDISIKLLNKLEGKFMKTLSKRYWDSFNFVFLYHVLHWFTFLIHKNFNTSINLFHKSIFINF